MTLANMRENGDSRPDHMRRATSGAVALRGFQDAVTANPQARPRPSMALSAAARLASLCRWKGDRRHRLHLERGFVSLPDECCLSKVAESNSGDDPEGFPSDVPGPS